MPYTWPGATEADGRFRLDLPTPPRPELPRVDGLLAGASQVDITPPPGMPKAGHSKNAQDGTGFRTRLRARVVHLRAGEASLALVALDLLAGSAIVHRAVAHEIADLVPVEGLFLAATHTHAGPGQYSGSEFYNDWASNRPGFDPGYTRFLVQQIASAVREAVERREPARMAVGSTEVWGLTRNRSLGAHVRNENLADRRTERQRAYAAVDPRLHLLRVDGNQGPLAAFSWFSIHGTGISPQDPAYNADVWAYLNRELEDRVQAATGCRPVSGAVVASHGDMTPAVRPGMLVYPEAERIGRGIGAAAAELHDRLGTELRADLELRAGLREIDLSTDPIIDGISLPEPRIGWAKAAGATENTTPVVHRLPYFRPGMGGRGTGVQGAKHVIGTERLHDRLVAPAGRFPRVLPVHLLRLGDTTVVGLPFEVTVEAGRRIAAEIGPDAFVSSLVNDHCDYLTTPEEYAAQHYEGASTLFGPRQHAFIAGAVRGLAADLDRGPVSDTVARRFDFGVRHYLPQPSGAPVEPRLERARFVEATSREDAHWELRWTGAAPGDLAWHEPMVRVEAESADGAWATAEDDQGWRIGVQLLGSRGGVHRYAARWFAPPLGRPGRHRFVLVANAGQPQRASAAFD